MNRNEKEIHLRLTGEEYAELMRQKEFLGFKNYSSLIRMYIRNGVCFNIDFNGLYEISTQIARVGNNINQIAVAVNQSHDITPYQIRLLQKHMDRIDEIIDKITDDKINISKYAARRNCNGGDNGDNQNHQSQG